MRALLKPNKLEATKIKPMNWYPTHNYTQSAQAQCLRGGALVRETMGVVSIADQLVFVGHDPGGSDG